MDPTNHVIKGLYCIRKHVNLPQQSQNHYMQNTLVIICA